GRLGAQAGLAANGSFIMARCARKPPTGVAQRSISKAFQPVGSARKPASPPMVLLLWRAARANRQRASRNATFRRRSNRAARHASRPRRQWFFYYGALRAQTANGRRATQHFEGVPTGRLGTQ